MLDSSRAVGLGLLLFGLAAAGTAFLIPLGAGGDWGARLFPLMASGTLILSGVAATTGEQAAAPDAVGAPYLPVLTLALLAIAYVWLMGRFGYLISTAAIVPATLWLFGIRRLGSVVVAAIALPLALHLLFFRALGVFPPLGRWVDLLDLIPVL